jgi:hypothetical protein
MKGKKRPIDEVIDGAILAAKVSESASNSVLVLAPLKVSMSSIITLLDNLKVGWIHFHKGIPQAQQTL